jgi:hypothetical protein
MCIGFMQPLDPEEVGGRFLDARCGFYFIGVEVG